MYIEYSLNTEMLGHMKVKSQHMLFVFVLYWWCYAEVTDVEVVTNFGAQRKVVA